MKKRIISIVSIILVVAMLSVVLVACAPKDTAAAEKKMEKKGYDVEVIDDLVTISKGKITDEDFISATAVYYHDKDKLNEDWKEQKKEFDRGMEDLEDEIAKAEKELKDESNADLKEEMQKFIDEMKEYKKNAAIKKSGNWIVSGNKKVVNDFCGL